MVGLVLVEHCYDFVRVEGHVHVEVGGDVPRRVVLAFLIGTKLYFEVLHVINAGKDDAVEGGVHSLHVSVEIFVAEHAQEIQEQLVVGAFIDLVDEEEDGLGLRLAKCGNLCRQALKRGTFVFIQPKVSLFRSHTCSFGYFNTQPFAKTFYRIKNSVAYFKTDRYDNILLRQVYEQSLQRRCLAELPGTVDGEVRTILDILLYLRELPARVNHVMLGRVAAAGGVESLLHVLVFCKDSYFSYLHNITYFNSRILTSAKTQRQLAQLMDIS